MGPNALLPPYLLISRLYVPGDLRAPYRAAMARVGAAVGEHLLRSEIYEDTSLPGFFLEAHLFRDVSSWAAVREGALGALSEAFEARRGIVTEDAEEVLTWALCDGASTRV